MVVAEISDYGQPPAGAQPSITVTTDASRQGWVVTAWQYGLWGLAPYGHARSHQFVGVPNCPPLTPLLFALLRQRTVLIRMDNVTVAAYINKQGGTHSTRLNALAAQLWTWCRREGVFLWRPISPPGQPHSGLPVPGRVLPRSGPSTRRSWTRWRGRSALWRWICSRPRSMLASRGTAPGSRTQQPGG